MNDETPVTQAASPEPATPTIERGADWRKREANAAARRRRQPDHARRVAESAELERRAAEHRDRRHIREVRQALEQESREDERARLEAKLRAVIERVTEAVNGASSMLGRVTVVTSSTMAPAT
jgi:hypothetical protein